MKTAFPSLLPIAVLTVGSCKKINIQPTDCIAMSPHQEWVTEKLLGSYEISFPANYEGGSVGFEGTIFRKTRKDKAVFFSSSYCNELGCGLLGPALAAPIPGKISIKSSANQDLPLNLKQEFCVNDKITGILYYNDNPYITSRLYLLSDTTYFGEFDH